MAEKGRAPALSHLSELSNFLGVSISSLTHGSSTTITSSSASSPSSTSPLPTIISDLHVLFTQLSKETTALSLAFAPPSESWDAVLGTSKKLQETSGKIVYCIGLLRSQSASSSTATESLLTKEYRFTTLTVLESLKELIDSCCKIYNALPAGTKIPQDQRKRILTHTSLVWKAAEKTDSLSKDEGEAFKKVWKGMMEMLDDALGEVEELSMREVTSDPTTAAQDKDEADEDDENDIFDDEDDESPLSAVEMEIVQSAFQLCKFVKALFKKISLNVPSLSSQSDTHPSPSENATTILASLHKTGQTLLAAQDDLASALYPPQSRPDILQLSQTYQKLALEICHLVLGSTCAPAGAKENDGALEDGMKSLSVRESSNEAKGTSKQDPQQLLEKWIKACVAQIRRAGKELEERCAALGR